MRDTVFEQQPPEELMDPVEPDVSVKSWSCVVSGEVEDPEKNEESDGSDVSVKSWSSVVSGEVEDPVKNEEPDGSDVSEELEDPVNPEEHGTISVESPTQPFPPRWEVEQDRVRVIWHSDHRPHSSHSPDMNCNIIVANTLD